MVDEIKDGVAPAEPTEYEKHLKLVERREAANKETRELVERQEKLAAQKLIEGKAEAGQPMPEKKEETPQEYAARLMANQVEGENGTA